MSKKPSRDYICPTCGVSFRGILARGHSYCSPCSNRRAQDARTGKPTEAQENLEGLARLRDRMADELRMPWEKKFTPEKVRQQILDKAKKEPPEMRRSVRPLNPRFIAARDGLHTYQGEPCKHCKGTLRYVNNAGCVPCHIRRDELRRTAKKEAKGRALREQPVILPDQP